MAPRRSVFEEYAHEYDLITNAAQREEYHRKEVAALVDRFHPTNVLDAGCATGLTSKLFAEHDIPTVGLDRSRKMLDVAKEKYRGADLPLTFRFGHFESLPRALDESFDLVVCLANSISGVDTAANLRRTLQGFKRVLKPGGWLVLQLLNYAAIKEGEVMPIRATRNDGILYCRYSIRRRMKLAIHVVRVDLDQDPPGMEPFVHEFDNFAIDQVERAVKNVGFVQRQEFGDLHLSRKFTKTNRDLVMIGRKPL